MNRAALPPDDVSVVPSEPTADAPASAPFFRRAGMIAIWLAGTVLAMVLATLAVHLAGANVTQRPVAMVSRSQIDAELARQREATPGAGSSSPSAVPPETETAVAAPVLPAADDASTPAPGAPASSVPGAIPSVAPTTVRTDPSGASSGGGSGSGATTSTGPRAPTPSNAPASAAPAAPTTPVTTAAAASSQQTIVLTGGTVVVRCIGDAAQRVSSNPAPGFTMKIASSGPAEVEVRFEGAEHKSELKATCVAGTVVPQPREDGDEGAEGTSMAHADSL